MSTTKQFYPFDSGAGAGVRTAQWSKMFRQVFADGVVKDYLNSLLVYADSTGMQVKVKSGAGLIAGHYYENTAEEIVAINSANASLPRYDLVVLQVDWSLSDNQISVTTVRGTAASSPSIPTVTQTANIWQILLAVVYVGAGVTTIAAANVTDLRTMVGPDSSGDQTAISTDEAWLDLTTSYQKLLDAPSTGVRAVDHISFENEDSSVTAMFYFKIQRNGVDYWEFSKSLGPNDSFSLDDLPIRLQTTDSIWAKTSVSVTTGRACAGYHAGSGGMALLNFTGTTFMSVLTAPTGVKYAILGQIYANTYTSSDPIVTQVIDGASAVKRSRKKTLGPAMSWFSSLKLVLNPGYALQVKHSTAGYTGCALVGYQEVA